MEIYHPRDEELLREMRRVRRSAKRKRLIWGMIIILILSIAAGIFVFNRYYQLAIMRGPAMGDSLPDGSIALVRRMEADDAYKAGDVILYEKRIASPLEITILSPKGKIRDYCQYILYRDLGTTRQYFTYQEEQVHWSEKEADAEVFQTDPEGTLHLETDGMPNGEYWLKEIKASYGQNVLTEPIPVTVNNPTRIQMKRILAARGDRVVLSPYAETRVNGQEIDRTRTSGRTADAGVEARRVNVGKGVYFVQGDQLSLSEDSRELDYGTVLQDEVLGRVDFVLWPVRCFGLMNGTTEAASAAEQGGAE